MSTEEAWPFHPNYRVDLPPTQIKSAVERCKKKNIVDLSAPCDETQNIIQAVFAAYSKKKERARAASSKSRAAKASAEEPAIDDVAVEAIEPTEETVCEVVAEAEAAPPTPAEPEPPTKAAKPPSQKRTDNIAQEKTVPPRGEVAPAPKRAAAEAPPARRRGGLCALVAEVSLNA